MSPGLLSLVLLAWAVADCPAPPTLSAACSSALPDRQHPLCIIRLGQRGGPIKHRGRKVRDYLDDDDSDDETSSGKSHAEVAGFPAGLSPAAGLARSRLGKAADARRPAPVLLIYAYCTLLL